MVRSPLTAARATFALKAGEWFRRGRLLMVSPVHGDYRRHQAEIPLIALSKFPRPALVSLVYLRLSSVTEALARVRRRVEAGGHDIPPEVIERRFQKSADYFETIYKPIVDDWHLWESREGQFIRVASSDSP